MYGEETVKGAQELLKNATPFKMVTAINVSFSALHAHIRALLVLLIILYGLCR